MSELLARVTETISNQGLVRKGQSLVVAVSGGLDSMVLLELLRILSHGRRWRLKVAHLNHRLRGRSSDADEKLVRQTSARHKLPVVIGQADVRQFARRHGLSIEMAARHLRHDFFARVAKQSRIRTIALAHHADDQLELFFLRLLRGSSAEGLTGMKWRNPSPADPRMELVRPLLDIAKSELRAYAATNAIRFREDATNKSVEFQRNRLRVELLPLLREHYQPALDNVIARTSEILRAESELINQLACNWLRAKSIPNRTPQEAPAALVWEKSQLGQKLDVAADKDVRAPGLPFEDLPLAVQRRVIYLQLLDFGLQVDFDLVECLREKPNRPVNVRRKEGILPFQPGSATVFRDKKGRLQLQIVNREIFTTESLNLVLSGARMAKFEQVTFWWKVGKSSKLVQRKGQNGCEWFDADQIGANVLLRHWRPGDRFQPIGMAEAVKLQDLFTNTKIPRGRRHELILATTVQGEIFWVEGLRIAERFKLTKKTIRHLQWKWRRGVI